MFSINGTFLVEKPLTLFIPGGRLMVSSLFPMNYYQLYLPKRRKKKNHPKISEMPTITT